MAVVAEKHIIIQSNYKIGPCLISRHRLVKPLGSFGNLPYHTLAAMLINTSFLMFTIKLEGNAGLAIMIQLYILLGN